MDLISSTARAEPGSFGAFFDLDRTLCPLISGREMVVKALGMGYIGTTDIVRALWLYLSYRLGLREAEETINRMAGWMKGRSLSSLEEISRAACHDSLIPSVFSAARKEIALHKVGGARLVILSSAPEEICRIMAEELGFDAYLCSSMESEMGILTGRPSGRLCYGDEKLIRLTGYCSSNGLAVQGAWYYSDSISDLPVLAEVGHPVCINPDKKLRREAAVRGWRTENWSN